MSGAPQPERWRQIEDLFHEALECEPARRPAFLDTACGGDALLREEVESLLASYEKGGLTAPAFEEGIRLLETDHEQSMAGRHIGPYRVISELGSGGMGAVYLATRSDEAFRKEVAIKLIKRGLDTDFVVRRFRSERQILASLEHPNISRLLDGGATNEGLPYFVMEYIQGEPIDKYCDAHKLNIDERLRLFRCVCAAVHYAHQNLVVHRDIKPGNILVTVDGVPRLLDFGIAKLLGSEASQATALGTVTAVRPMTPQYASPEQVRGEAISTASDVYALGVLLYQLLTGHNPYRSTSSLPGELERAICNEEPDKPSVVITRVGENAAEQAFQSQTPQRVSETCEGTSEKLRRRLRGDLDNIVLMAMRKEPQRRYASVQQFSEDIRRHLEGLPVIARADTRGYRTAKFVGRHRTGVALISLLVISLFAGVLATSWQARIARSERARAQQQFNDVRKLATSFLFEFNSAIQSLPGATPARKLLVQRALEYLSKLGQEAHGDRGLQRELAEAYLKVGDLQGNPYEPNLGDIPGAQQSYEKALQVSTALVHADANDHSARQYLARSYQSLGEVLPQLGKPSEGVSDLRQAAELMERLAAGAPDDAELHIRLANCYQSLGDLQGHSGLQNLGDREAALESYRKALAIFEALATQNGNQRAQGGVAVLQIRIGDMLHAQGDLQASMKDYRRAVDMAVRISASNPQNDRVRRILALSYRKLGEIHNEVGDLKQALRSELKALEINEALMAADPDNVQASMNFVLSLRSVGDLLNRTGDRAGALGKYRRAIEILERLSTAAPANLFIRGRLAEALISTGAALAQDGKLAEAHGATSRGLATARELALRPNATPDELNLYALSLLTCQPASLRQPATALQSAKLAVERSGGRDSKSLDILAQAYFRNGDSAGAIDAEEKALKLLPVPDPQQPPSPLRQRLEARVAEFRKSPQRN